MSISNFFHLFGKVGGDVENFFAPGRINIIGEHTDYNGGYVLPCPIKLGTQVYIRRRTEDNLARLASSNYPGVFKISLDERVTPNPEHKWANYPKGVIHMMQNDGHKIPGFDVMFTGNIPNGAGLSSSASIQMAMAMALNTMFKLNYSTLDLVKLVQQSENKFIGVNCGILDPFAIGMAKEDHAIYLHCDTLEHKYVPLNLEKNIIMVMDTNKRRALNESNYNERRSECDKALAALISAGAPIKTLSDLTPDAFKPLAAKIADETQRRRATHVVNENHRVRQAVTVLEAGNAKILGMLLNASHASLRDDYEVSCKELDTMVEEAQKNPACLGARMTGAGFGGCAIALVEKRKAEEFKHAVSTEYEKITGLAPNLFY